MPPEVNHSSRTWLWVLALFLVVETQYIVNGWVTNYGDNKDIVSYVSFAGTIVSIILAVLAIVYSYYQNFAQQRDSANIATQISELRRLVEHADQSSTEFSNELKRLEGIGDKLDANTELVRKSQESISVLSDKLDLLKEQKVESATPSLEPEELPLDKIAQRLLKVAISTQVIMYKILKTVAERKFEFDDIDKLILKPTMKQNEATRDWFESQITAYAYLLLDLDIVSLVPGSAPNFKLGGVNEAFAKATDAAFAELLSEPKGADSLFDLGKLDKLLSQRA